MVLLLNRQGLIASSSGNRFKIWIGSIISMAQKSRNAPVKRVAKAEKATRKAAARRSPSPQKKAASKSQPKPSVSKPKSAPKAAKPAPKAVKPAPKPKSVPKAKTGLKSKSTPKQPAKDVSSSSSPPAKTPAKSKAATPAKSPAPTKRSAVKAAADPGPTKVAVKEQKKIVKVVTKGGAAVDLLVPGASNFRVHHHSGESVCCTLNQSNVEKNNNKFYIIQMLQHQITSKFFVFNRWGRVGQPGMQALKGPFDEATALQDYHKKKRQKVSGGYIEIAINYEEKGAEEQSKPKAVKKGTSKLPNELQRLIDLIFDTKQINHAMKEIGYDAKKMPLGKLGEQTIKEAYKVLNTLSKAIDKKDNSEINRLTSQFYSLIPHDFGRANMANFIIKEQEQVKLKLDMLQSLTDMKIATRLLGGGDADTDIIDQNYKKLNCTIKPLQATSQIHKAILTYIDNTRNSYKPVVEDIFEVCREEENKEFNKKMGNNLLLWHGSGVANFVGILSQGLRIAPPEAPSSGYLFGKGIYLADMFQKSAMYCRGSSDGSYLILLVEGALGKMNVLLQPNFNAKQLMQKNGMNSTKCHGGQAPPQSSYKKLDSFSIPLGKVEKTGSGSYKGHNEFIVYQKSQARLRYIIRYRLK